MTKIWLFTRTKISSTWSSTTRKSSRDRVALAHEEIETYDASYYETQLVRAVESVLSPLGWDRTGIHRELAETQEMDVTAFTSVDGK